MATTKITTPELFDLSTVNTALRLPNGSTATRPASPSQGEWRFNTDLKYVEFYDGSDWRQIDTEVTCTTNTVDYPTTNAAYYKFDSTAIDQTTNNKDGVATDVTFYNGQQYSQGAVFNGSSSKIDLADNIIGAGTSSSSASIWFKSTSGNAAGDSECIIDSWANDISKPGWGLFMEPAFGAYPEGHLGLANYYLGGTSSYTSVGYRDGLWHHAVVVFDHTAQTLELFVDGNSTPVLSQTANASPVDIFTTKSAIGYQNANASYPRLFNGVLDQCRIFAVALTPDQISELYNEVQCPCTTDNNDNPTTNVAYYKLDGNANDSTSNGNNGTWSGTEAYEYGPYGIAGSFNGSSSYINIPSAIYSSITGPFTLSAWVKTTSSGSYKIIIGMGGVNGVAAKGLSMWMDSSGVLYASWGNGSTENYWNVSATTSINTGDWFHVAITVDGLTNPVVKGYVNGVAEGSGSTGTDSISFDTSFTIGARDMGGTVASYWDGSIDQVRIFSSALSATQVTSLYDEVYCTTVSKLNIFNESTSSCLALYEFEDNADSTDSSTYDGLWSGTEAYGGGQYKKGGIFNGTSSKITVPAILSSYYTGSVSFSAWFNMSNSSSNIYAIIASDGTTPVSGKTILVSVSNGVLELTGYNFGTFVGTGTTNVADGEWHNLIVVLDNSAGTFNLYLDGNSTAEITHTNSLGTNLTLDKVFATNWNIGAQDTIRYFDGSIDQVRIFNKALSETERLQVYTE